ncbi:uncharacterized protein [Palaemon carinicauda]|uniref:uncharacterized protein n=1 Tax=Palaemon carinicauda TaxID=392227 RepID=UPI0035B66E09
MAFFADHDFTAVDIYLYFEFPCDNCTMDLNDLTYGFNMQVKGHVTCLNPNPIVTVPTYPNSEINVIVNCPPPVDICPYYQSIIAPSGRKHSPALLDGEVASPTERRAASLFIITEYGDQNILSAISDADEVINLTINDTTCNLFSDQSMDLTVFTNVKNINILLCDTIVPCNSILVNSANLMRITVHLPNIAYCNPGCIVSNQATTPPGSPAINCQPLA